MPTAAVEHTTTPPPLLHGPYKAPAVLVGDRVDCLYRGADVIITAWTDAHIPWPRCRAVSSRGGSGLLMDAELARAVRTESAAAVGYWFGVGTHAVWHWRKALGVTRTNNPATHSLTVEAATQGGAASAERGITTEERQLRSRNARRLKLISHARAVEARRHWTPEELALLGTVSDEDVAARIGRGVDAVRIMRTRRGIPSARDRRRR